jgi:hypothetical protein
MRVTFPRLRFGLVCIVTSDVRSPRPWMRLLVGRFQVRRAHVRVDLRRDQAFVAEEFLDAADVGAAVEEVRGEAVAERVRAGALVEAGHLEIFFQHAGNAARCQTSAEFVCEDGCFAALFFARRKLADCEPALECFRCIGADW